jgi:hypothetical protein
MGSFVTDFNMSVTVERKIGQHLLPCFTGSVEPLTMVCSHLSANIMMLKWDCTRQSYRPRLSKGNIAVSNQDAVLLGSSNNI